MNEEEYRAYRAATDLREPYRYTPAKLLPPILPELLSTSGVQQHTEHTCGRPELVLASTACAAVLHESTAEGAHIPCSCSAATHTVIYLASWRALYVLDSHCCTRDKLPHAPCLECPTQERPRIPAVFLTATKQFRAPKLSEAPLIAFTRDEWIQGSALNPNACPRIPCS